MADTYAKEGLTVLAVNAADEDKATLKRFVRRQKLKQQILLNGGSVFENRYHGKVFPTSLWIDRAGVIVDTEVGYDGPETLKKKTERLMATTSE